MENIESISCESISCESIREVNIYTNEEFINYHFEYGFRVKMIVHEGVDTIPYRKLLYCSWLVEIILPDSITELDCNQFKDCISLKKIRLPNTIKKISGSLFAGCYELKSLIIPDSVVLIEMCAFDGTGITELILPKNLICIKPLAFRNCKSLSKMVIMNNDLQITSNMFENLACPIMYYKEEPINPPIWFMTHCGIMPNIIYLTLY
jgi:hypothetical protein